MAKIFMGKGPPQEKGQMGPFPPNLGQNPFTPPFQNAAGGRPNLESLREFVVEEFTKRHASQLAVTSQEEAILRRLAARHAKHMPSQIALLEDPSPRVAAICTRRAGKTYVCMQLIFEALLRHPGSIVQYIAMTRQKALDLMWRKLKVVAEEIGLDAHWDDQNLRATFPNGSIIRCGGASDKDEIEKYRGDSYPLVVIDEAASFGPRMEELVIAAIEPALMDYSGKLVMVGSPGEAQAGYFWEIYAGMRTQWSVHKWSFMSNEFLPADVRSEEYITRTTGLPLSAPLIQREYFGNWVADASSLVYRFSDARNTFSGALEPGHDWQFILGIDLGYHDPTAFVVTAWARTCPFLFVVESEAYPHLLPSEIAEKIHMYKRFYPKLTKIVADTGGSMARSNVEEWNRRYGFGIIAAQKREKATYIEMFNSELVMGRIKVYEGAPLMQEWRQLVWEIPDPDSVRTDYKRREHPGFPNHLADACLYAFRESIHWLSQAPAVSAAPGTPAALNKAQLDAKLQALKRAASRQRFNYNRLTQ